MTDEGLTPKQKKALDFIVGYIKKHGYSPAYREISTSPGNAMRLVDELCVLGYLRRGGRINRRRNIILLFDADAEPNWQGVAAALKTENDTLRLELRRHGIAEPRRLVAYD